MFNKILNTIILLLAFVVVLPAQNAEDIIRQAENKLRGASSYGEMKMTIVRPTWTREVGIKSWSMGTEYSLILITAPSRDKGSAFLKREREMWSWQPSIDRSIKMPPSMMMQSWMGSDFTNDDLVKESSILDDYDHELLGSGEQQNRDCWKIELTAHEDAAVVWGKIIMWIDKEESMQLRTEFYDEDDYLINTMIGSDIKQLDGKWLPAKMEIVPAEEEGHKTVLEYQSLDFDIDIKEQFFSVQNMKRVK